MNVNYADIKINTKAVGEKIGALMEKKGITVITMADVLGVTVQSVYYYLKGEKLPKVKHFVVVARMLGTTIDDLLVIEEQPQDDDI